MGTIGTARLVPSLNKNGLRILARVIARNLLGSYPCNGEHFAEPTENPDEGGQMSVNPQTHARKRGNEDLH